MLCCRYKSKHKKSFPIKLLIWFWWIFMVFQREMYQDLICLIYVTFEDYRFIGWQNSLLKCIEFHTEKKFFSSFFLVALCVSFQCCKAFFTSMLILKMMIVLFETWNTRKSLKRFPSFFVLMMVFVLFKTVLWMSCAYWWRNV